MDNASRRFEKFRRTGSSRSLASVFDGTAPELLRVATHLTGDPSAAEDLVQATFLTAIEKAESYDSARPVQHWLLGILHNHARNHRRRRRPSGTVDGSVEPESDSNPQDNAEARELRETIRASLASVPQPYRDVVELRWIEGLSTTAIAEQLARPAGTVRTQASRGMEFLRNSVPRHLSFAALGYPWPARGLAAIRSEVLSTAATGAAGAAASVSTAAAVGGNGILRIGLLCFVLLGVGYVTWISTDSIEIPNPGGPQASALPGDSEEASPLPGEDRSSPDEGTRQEIDVPTEGAPNAKPSAAKDAAEPDRLILTIVDDRGRPVPQAKVVFDVTEQAANLGRFFRMGTRTADSEGRLEADVDEMIGTFLAYKNGVGSSGTIAMDHDRKGTDEPWKIVLLPGTKFRGVVLDPAGAAVAHADVVANPEDIGEVHRLRTGADGRFEIALAREILYDVRAESAGWATDTYIVDTRNLTENSPPLKMRLAGAHRITGRVHGPDGRPVTAADLRLLKRGGHPRRPLRHEQKSDAEGAFEIGLSDRGRTS